MSVSITFAAGAHGSGSGWTITAEPGATIRLPDRAFTCLGCIQGGWTTYNPTGSAAYYNLTTLWSQNYAWELNGEYIVPSENKTLYPWWGYDAPAPSVSAALSPTGGGTVSWWKTTAAGSQTRIDFKFGPREGYTFDHADATYGGRTYSNITALVLAASGSVAVTAYYTKVTYTVACQPGSYGSGTAQTLTKTHGETLTLPGAIFTRAGYTQTGWATSDGGALAYQLGGSYTANAATTLYPVWSGVALTVTYNANGGYVTPRTATVYYGTAYGPLPTPRRTGYTFAGWWTAATGGTQVVAATTVTALMDHAIFAHWSKDTICVVLDPNGGDLAPSSLWINVASGVYPALPTATGLVGWFTASAGGTQKTQGSALAESADHTLYAHWTVTHTLTLRDAANSSVSTRTVAEGSAYGSLPLPTRTGYTFAGWWTGTVSGSQVSAATTMGDRDVTIYARWTPTALTITFDVNGGTAISPSSRTALYGQQYGTLPKAKKTGKKFDGWWTAATGGTEITATTIATSSLTVYAHWRDPASVPLGYISTSGS